MAMITKKKGAVALLVLSQIFTVAQSHGAPQSVYVQVKQSKIRSEPKLWARSIASVSYGDKLSLSNEEGGWSSVKDSQSHSGFIPTTALSDRRVVLSGKGGGAIGADSEDVILAGKGFSREVEQQYARTSSVSFSAVDKMEKLRASDSEVAQFVKEGATWLRGEEVMRKIITVTLALTSLLLMAGCTPEMNKFGSSILSKTGIMSESQANKFLEAGTKLSKAAGSVSDEQEYYLGRSVSASIFSQYRSGGSAGMTQYLQKVGAVLASNSSRPETFGGYHFVVLNSSEVNAMSAPGGFVFVSEGLLSRVHSEDELAAVLAHEIGHVALKHGLSAISEANLTDALATIGTGALEMSGNSSITEVTSLFGDSVKDVVTTLTTKGFSRSQEYDADGYAAAVLAKSGYNPQALVTMLKTLEGAKGLSSGWFATHPEPSDRIEEVEDKIEEIGSASSTAGKSARDARFARIVGRKAS